MLCSDTVNNDLNIQDNAFGAFGWFLWYLANLLGERLNDELEEDFFAILLIFLFSMVWNLGLTLAHSDNEEYEDGIEAREYIDLVYVRAVINIAVDVSFYYSDFITNALPLKTSGEKYFVSMLANPAVCLATFMLFSKITCKRNNNCRDEATVVALSAFVYTLFDGIESLNDYSKPVLILFVTFLVSCLYDRLFSREGREKLERFIKSLAVFLGLALNYAVIFCNLYGTIKNNSSSVLTYRNYLQGNTPSYIDSFNHYIESLKYDDGVTAFISIITLFSFVLSCRYVVCVYDDSYDYSNSRVDYAVPPARAITRKIVSAVLSVPACVSFVFGAGDLCAYNLFAAVISPVCSFMYFQEVGFSTEKEYSQENIECSHLPSSFYGVKELGAINAGIYLVSTSLMNLSFSMAFPYYLPLPVAVVWGAAKISCIKGALHHTSPESGSDASLKPDGRALFLICALSDVVPVCVLASFSDMDMKIILLLSSAISVVYECDLSKHASECCSKIGGLFSKSSNDGNRGDDSNNSLLDYAA